MSSPAAERALHTVETRLCLFRPVSLRGTINHFQNLSEVIGEVVSSHVSKEARLVRLDKATGTRHDADTTDYGVRNPPPRRDEESSIPSFSPGLIVLGNTAIRQFMREYPRIRNEAPEYIAQQLVHFSDRMTVHMRADIQGVILSHPHKNPRITDFSLSISHPSLVEEQLEIVSEIEKRTKRPLAAPQPDRIKVLRVIGMTEDHAMAAMDTLEEHIESLRAETLNPMEANERMISLGALQYIAYNRYLGGMTAQQHPYSILDS